MTEELLPDWENSSRKEWEDREWENQQTWPREEKKAREHQHTTWEQWSLWDQFGSTGEIIQVRRRTFLPKHSNGIQATGNQKGICDHS